MPDKMCHECSECGVKFGVFVRKHHCRICGRIFCSNCSSYSIPAYRLNNRLNGTLRVCLDCFKIYQESQKWGRGGSQDAMPSNPHHLHPLASAPPFADGSRVPPKPASASVSITSHSSSSSMAPTRHSWDERSLVSPANVPSSPSRSSTIEFDNPVFFRRSLIKHGSLPGEHEENILALREVCTVSVTSQAGCPVVPCQVPG